MFVTSHRSRLLALALFALAGSVGMAQTKDAAGAASPADTKVAEQKKAAKEKAKKGAASAADLQKVIEQLNAQRETMIKDHDALQKQLQDATEAKRKEILEKMEEQRKAFERSTKALQKQLQDERRKQREGAAAPKR